jgi:small subunit ribosomal protein S3
LKQFFPGKSKAVNMTISIQEVARPGLESTLVMQNMIQDLERRMAFRRVLKSTIERVKKAGALGVKLTVSGRLNGAEIARTEKLSWGKIPLTNLRADIDYAQSFAQTMAGTIGVKVWIYRGDVFEQDRLSQYLPQTPARREGGRDGGRPQDRRDNRGGGNRGNFRDRPPMGDRRAPAPAPVPAPAAAPSEPAA